LDTLAGLLDLHAILQAWLYAWRSCPHHEAWQYFHWEYQDFAEDVTNL